MEDLQPDARISILIVSRNEGERLRRTLASLAASDPASIEVVVVDNASTDGSARIDGDFPFVKMLRMQRNFGWTKSANVGMRTAKGEFLCLVPPGIEFEPDTIAKLEQALLADSSALAVCPLAVDDGGTIVTQAYKLPDAAMVKEFSQTGSLGASLPVDTSAPAVRAEYVVHSPLFMRRVSMAGMNFLDERYGQFWSDAEIYFQIRRAGKSVVILPSVRVKSATPALAFPQPLDRWGSKLKADAILSGAAYLGKHSGFGSSFGYRIGAILGALVSAKIGLFLGLISGQKIDGTQGQ